MLKQILTFSVMLLLVACAGTQVRRLPTQARNLKKVNFLVEGKTQAGFKITGTMDGMMTDGVVTIKKIGEEDVEVVLMTGGIYKVLHAIVSPEGIIYRYLFKEVDTSLIRGRITQLLDLLFSKPGTYAGMRREKTGETTLIYKGARAKETFTYQPGEVYPIRARTITTLNSADLIYADYMPVSADGEVQIPHTLVYKDGKILLELQLISLR